MKVYIVFSVDYIGHIQKDCKVFLNLNDAENYCFKPLQYIEEYEVIE